VPTVGSDDCGFRISFKEGPGKQNPSLFFTASRTAEYICESRAIANGASEAVAAAQDIDSGVINGTLFFTSHWVRCPSGENSDGLLEKCSQTKP